MRAGSAGSSRVCSVNSGWKIFWKDVSFPFPGLSNMGERRTGAAGGTGAAPKPLDRLACPNQCLS